MTKNRSKLFVGVGVLCFVGVMALWLGASGDRAIADAENPVTIQKTLTQAVDKPVQFAGKAASVVAFEKTEGLVQRLSVQLSVTSREAKRMKVYLTSPSGTKVLLVDGARSKAVTVDGLEGWFGADGLQTTESLAAFAGEPVNGRWTLNIEGARGALKKWSLTTDVGPNTLMAGMETFADYLNSNGGCDCSVTSTSDAAGGLSLALLLLGVVLVRRRR